MRHLQSMRWKKPLTAIYVDVPDTDRFLMLPRPSASNKPSLTVYPRQMATPAVANRMEMAKSKPTAVVDAARVTPME